MSDEPDSLPSRNRTLGAWFRVVLWIVGLLLVYVSVFLMVLIDELVLRTHWMSRFLPEVFSDVFRWIYAPFLPVIVIPPSR